MNKNLYLVCDSDFYYKNRIFDINSPYNRDDAWHPMSMLREKFKSNYIELNTYDYLENESRSENTNYAFIFNNIPKDYKYYAFKYKDIHKYLILLESTIINKTDAVNKYYDDFKKIFTYQDNIIDNKKYLKINYSFVFPETIIANLPEKNNLCTMIAGNKIINHTNELYSKRVEAIRWFEDHHPNEFDLYGIGWDNVPVNLRPTIQERIFKKIAKMLYMNESMTKKYQSYKGKVENKIDILRKYKFAICYENFQNDPGWITEKIFDCFFAGCVPVYWGAPNIQEHIPPNCFIDKREFNTYEELYQFMASMTDEKYMEYINRIRAFLKSTKAYPFSVDYFCKTIIDGIVKDLNIQ